MYVSVLSLQYQIWLLILYYVVWHIASKHQISVKSNKLLYFFCNDLNKRLAMQRKAPQRIRKYPSHLNKHRPAKGGKFKQIMNMMMNRTSIDRKPENIIKSRIEYASARYSENIQYSHTPLSITVEFRLIWCVFGIFHVLTHTWLNISSSNFNSSTCSALYFRRKSTIQRCI